MLFYVLDSSFNPFMVIENYESAIWTDRYWECGDFSIEMYADNYTIANLKTDQIITTPDSDRAMIIEKIQIETDVEKGNKLTLSGRSLESILERRVVWGKKNFMDSASTTADPKGIPIVDVLETLFNENIISPTNEARKIDNFVFEKPTDEKITKTLIIAQYIGDTLYDIVSSMCKELQIGFKVRLSSDNKFIFSLFIGTDRSFDNTDNNPYVIFSPNFENLVTSKYYESTSIYKNVAFVEGASDSNGNPTFAYSYLKENDAEPTGMLRRETYVDASGTSTKKDDNSDMTAAEYVSVLQEKGTEELAETEIESAFDGTLDTTGSFKYGEDFFEGDIVQVESEYGQQAKVRIIEMILADDGTDGSKACYPTFQALE